MKTSPFLILSVIGAAVVALSGCGNGGADVDGAGEPGEAKRTFYVSRTGNNVDGRSWETAWRELAEIAWEELEPGDLVLVDGGETSMIYETTLTFERSGAHGAPIVIRRADEAGRNGQIVLTGGRTGQLPWCRQQDYARDDRPSLRQFGIESNGQSWIYVDGTRNSGWLLTGFTGAGIRLDPNARHLTFRNLEVFDNGSTTWVQVPEGSTETPGWHPYGSGVLAAGERILLERMVIRDNGRDAVRTDGRVANLVVRRSWLHNSRPHATQTKEPFNVCAQPAGVRVSPGGQDLSGLRVEDSMVGPGFSHGLLLSDENARGEWAVMNDVTLKNSVLVSHHGESAVANLAASVPEGREPKNWRLERVTSLGSSEAAALHVSVRGGGHSVVDSLFVGGGELQIDAANAERNCQSPTVTGAAVGEVAELKLVDATWAGVGTTPAEFDLTYEAGSPCVGTGASVTSPAVLLADAALPEKPGVFGVMPVDPENAAPTVSFTAPASGAMVTAGQALTLTATANDSDGTIARVEFLVGQMPIGIEMTAPYTRTWTPTAGTHTLVARAFDDDGASAEATVTITATDAPTAITFEAESGTLSGGFETINGCVVQTTPSTTVGTGGKATYSFQVTKAGPYIVKGVVTAPGDSENSFFVNIDADPDATHIWDLTITTTPQEQTVWWRNSGLTAQVFQLTAGTHQLVVFAREANSCVDRFTIEPQP